MKTHLLLVPFLCTAITGIAQTTVNNIDSSFYSKDNGTTFTVSQIAKRTFNSYCHNDTLTYTYFDFQNASQTPMSATRYLYNYFPDGNVQQSIFQTSPQANDTFTNASRDTYTYSASGNETADVDDSWDGSQWVPYRKSTITYNATGKTIQYLLQQWNEDSQTYVNGARDTIVYNTAGYQTLYSSQVWDTLSNTWIPQFEVSSVYDMNNYLTSDTLKGISFTSNVIKINVYNTYYNNSRGKADSAVSFNPADSSTTKDFYSYYPDSITNHQIYSYFYNKESVLTNVNRATYLYDTTGNILTDSSIYEYSGTVNDSDFILSNVLIYRRSYNPDSTFQFLDFGTNDYFNGSVDYRLTRVRFYYTPCFSALPVTLLSFTATKNNNNAVLQWKTANETNTASFNVQRSMDGVHYATIGSIKAAGNSSGERSYAYTDFNISQLGASKLYYHLAQQDINGSVHNSAVAQIDIVNGKPIITISPNPVRNSIGIYSPVAMPNAVIRITSMNGTVVYTSRSNLAAGSKLVIDASLFAKGIYTVMVQSNNSTQVLKLVKE